MGIWGLFEHFITAPFTVYDPDAKREKELRRNAAAVDRITKLFDYHTFDEAIVLIRDSDNNNNVLTEYDGMSLTQWIKEHSHKYIFVSASVLEKKISLIHRAGYPSVRSPKDKCIKIAIWVSKGQGVTLGLSRKSQRPSTTPSDVFNKFKNKL
jgi:hypothetical protein